MRILGFDTNKNFIAWALVDVSNDKERIIEYGRIDDDKMYYHNLIELIKSHDVIAVENFAYYKQMRINDDSIESIKRIGHIQMACRQLFKILWEFKRPDILQRLFGSRSLQKGKANRLFSVRLGADIKKIPQHNKDAAMAGVYANYHILFEAKYKEDKNL